MQHFQVCRFLVEDVRCSGLTYQLGATSNQDLLPIERKHQRIAARCEIRRLDEVPLWILWKELVLKFYILDYLYWLATPILVILATEDKNWCSRAQAAMMASCHIQAGIFAQLLSLDAKDRSALRRLTIFVYSSCNEHVCVTFVCRCYGKVYLVQL